MKSKSSKIQVADVVGKYLLEGEVFEVFLGSAGKLEARGPTGDPASLAEVTWEGRKLSHEEVASYTKKS